MLDVNLGEGYLKMRPFGSHNGAYYCYVIDLAIMLLLLSLVFKVQVGASNDGVYGSEGWEIGNLLGRLLVLLWRWSGLLSSTFGGVF
jgi:hypothetical protein